MRKHLITIPILLVTLTLLLAACGNDSGPPADLTPPAQACVVVEGQKGLINQDKPAPLVVDQAKSPAYCNARTVIDDFQAGLSWYQAKTKDKDYGPDMMVEMSGYYAGPLLQESRASLYYNQQGGRVVIGNWDNIIETTGPEWSQDGRRATMTVRVGGYKLLTFPAGHPEQADEKTSQFEVWVETLAYDDASKHWKVVEAQSRFDNPIS